MNLNETPNPYETMIARSSPAAWPFPTKNTEFPFSLLKDAVSAYFNLPQTNLAEILGLKIVHVVGQNNKGGATFAYRKTSDNKNCRMVEVAVAYCSPKDFFHKRTGSDLAVSKFLDGEVILVPARTFNDDYTIPGNLRNMFWYSLNLR